MSDKFKMECQFKIRCLECGCEDVVIREEVEYDYEDNPYTSGYYLECRICGNNNLWS